MNDPTNCTGIGSLIITKKIEGNGRNFLLTHYNIQEKKTIKQISPFFSSDHSIT